MTVSTVDKLTRLRAAMAQRGLDALVIPRADEYLGEYVPTHNERLHWVTGFSGSAGVAIVLAQQAAVFVDGRYTVQVRQQVDTACFSLLHLHDDPHVAWLCEQLAEGGRVGYDSRVHTLAWQRAAAARLADAGMELVDTAGNLVDTCWQDRPQPIDSEVLLLDERYSGRCSTDKREQIAAGLRERGLDAALVFAPDAACWLLNIRGGDIPRLPVVLGFALLRADASVVFFCERDGMPDGFADHVGPGVRVHRLADAEHEFAALAGLSVLADPDTANAWCQLALEAAGAHLVAGQDPVLLPRACKNAAEIAGMRAAHRRDGIAEVRFLAWLDSEVAAGRLHDEAVLSDTLHDLRRELDLFRDLSFDTISAAGPNAAMAHYNHLNGEPAALQKDSVYLVDSGGQFLDGTTDITRTVAIGDPGDEVRRLFTLVLKGHIALATARFPRGTSGAQLDALARQFLWREGFDYDHGTGHGVGCFLSVHEGPQRIARAGSEAPLLPGMVVSNEPGYYRAGAFGMRCENLLVVVESGTLADTGRDCLAFEELTRAPFDRRLVLPQLLDPAERDWLDAYHRRVREDLQDHLAGAERDWLLAATAPLS